MSYYDDASLVFIPSGYKTSKAYSIKPTSGDGDLTFTRSNDTASRIGPDGLIEKVRTNQVLQSQTFDNAAWSKIGSTITANATAAPDGTTTADSNIESAALDEHGVSQVLAISAGLNTISVSVKANGRTRCRIGFANSSYGGMTAAQRFAYFDVSTGTVVQNISGGLSTIVSEGNGWYRCSVSQNLVAGDATGAIQLLFIDAGVNTFYTGNGTSGLFLWGAQLETGDIATDYIATTSAAVSVGPVANVPRLDYLNSSCPRLLLEPQRTNLALYSEQLDNATWGSANVAITANQALSPDGNANADLAVNIGSTSYLFQGLGSPFSGTYTISIFAKKNAASSFAFGLVAGGFTGGMGVKFNFDTQTFSTPTNYGNFTSMSASYQSYGNGWYRLNLTGTTATSTTYFFVLGSLQESFAVNAYVYGAQVEAGAYATSYIPTLGAAVTRGADAASKTGISSLIGQTEGTLFAEFNFDGRYDASGIIPIVIRTSNNEAYIFVTTAGSLLCELVVGGVPQASISGSIGAVGVKKVAFAYKQNDFVVYLNGVQVGTDSSGTVGAMADLNVGSYHSSGFSTMNGVNQALLFKTRLSNSELAALTA